MFCPKCGYEYNPEVSVCPDCGEKLVVESPEQRRQMEIEQLSNEHKNWIQLARLTSKEYALMFEETLRSKDIPVIIYSGTGYFGFIGVLGASSYGPIGGGFSVLVPEDFISDVDAEGRIVFGEEWDSYKLIDIE